MNHSRLRLACTVLLGCCFTCSLKAQHFDWVGCPSPYTSCTDQIAPTYLSGSWIEDDSSSEWTITADYAAPGASGSVTGTVMVFPPPDAYDCPVFNYTANGYFIPQQQGGNSSGSADFRWDATNPNPYITCSGYTPVTHMVFEGHQNSSGGIANKGNDTGVGQWSNDSGLKGPLSIETNLVLTPTQEALYPFTYFDPDGWGNPNAGPGYQTQLQLMQSLQDTTSYDPPDPNLNMFQGRQVFESANGTPSDSCYDTAANLGLPNPTARASILNSVWNVGWGWGNSNDFGPDGLGWVAASVRWYQQNLPDSAFPCTASIPQAMTIVNNIPILTNQLYAQHGIVYSITQTGVVVTKDSYSKSRDFQ